jgi:hypothetical protein
MICGCKPPEPVNVLVHWNEEMEQYAPPKRPYVGQIPITDKKRDRKLKSVRGVGISRSTEFSTAKIRCFQQVYGVTAEQAREFLSTRCEHERQVSELELTIRAAEVSYENRLR